MGVATNTGADAARWAKKADCPRVDMNTQADCYVVDFDILGQLEYQSQFLHLVCRFFPF